DHILPSHNRWVRALMMRALRQEKIHVHTGDPVVRIEATGLLCGSGARIAADHVFWTTYAAAPRWLRETKLSLDEKGFIRVNPTLETESPRGVFAVGDVASVIGFPRPKAGVFAARQGPPLFKTLRAALNGKELTPYSPQRQFLSLIGTS